MQKITTAELARTIDHSVLRPDATTYDVRAGCSLALEAGTASLCVRSSDVILAATLLKGSEVNVASVIGFPHGTASVAAKEAEIRRAILDGAKEVDVVMNYSRLLSEDLDYLSMEIRALVARTRNYGVLIKVIFENAYLDTAAKRAACRICVTEQVDFVKTSTGFGPSGAKAEDLQLMHALCAPQVRVKASGGIRTLDAALAALSLGASRIGTSSTREILKEAADREAKGTLGLMTPEQAVESQALA
ncbi:MAG: deoxyribose-phosphate aldolase [Clostridia bacterium]|nr:deoxyribose-phosphate aldolase [Clostridia bacterium]